MENTVLALPTKTRSSAAELCSLTRPSRALIARHRDWLSRARSTGFACSLPDELGHPLDIEQYLLQQRAKTFFLRISGNSMSGLGIFDGDLLVVHSNQAASTGSVVIAEINNELVVRQLFITQSGHILRAAHPDYSDIRLDEHHQQAIWGVVNWNARQH